MTKKSLTSADCLERVLGPVADGKRWRPIDCTRAIKKLEDKIYRLEAEAVKTNNRIARELGIRENWWRRYGEESPPETGEFEESSGPQAGPQEDEPIPRRQILLKAHEEVNEGRTRIEELRGTIDGVRDRLERREEEESSLLTFRGLERVRD